MSNKPEFIYEGGTEFEREIILDESHTAEKYLSTLQSAIKSTSYDGKETVIKLPYDEAVFNNALNLSRKFNQSGSLKYIFLVGIGGSNLGTQAVYKAIRGELDYLKDEDIPKIIFLDTLAKDDLIDIKNIIEDQKLSLDQFVIFFISKSGKTTETIANMNFLYSILDHFFDLIQIKTRLIIIALENSLLFQKTKEEQIIAIAHENVAGRFSIFSSAGLLPLVFTFGEEIKDLLSGAKDAISDGIQRDVYNNPALFSSVNKSLYYQKGVRISNSFFYHKRLEFIGRWYRQLISESLGKEKNLKNKTIHSGITPIVSIGTTDLHSMLQLYLGGSNDKLTTFFYVKELENDFRIGNYELTNGLVADIEGKSSKEITKAIYEGVKRSFIKYERPFMEMIIEKVDLYNIGYLMQFSMIEIMYLGNLLGVNTFDQPAVEDYKQETRELLAAGGRLQATS